MTTINVGGYDVHFPYPVPYDLQKTYMEKVISCLDKKTHAVLESPTGTGKTLCLFAPVTAWAKQRKQQNVTYVTNEDNREFSGKHLEQFDPQGNWGTKRKTKIWYTARTHSQIGQTVSEVRKCNTDGLYVGVMGARDQLCINKHVLEEKESYIKTVKCKELVKAKQCNFFNKLSHEKDIHKFCQKGEVLDIEDLIAVGKSCGVCPYFLAKRASETADIVLLPYNYIIDKESRESNGLYLQDDVIIFDEGHNVPSTCEESYEFQFTSLDIAIGIKNVKELMLSLTKLTETMADDEEMDVALHASNCIFMMEVLKKLESGLDELPVSKELLSVSSLYAFFENAGISEKTSKQLVDGIESFKNDSAKLVLSNSTLETFKLLATMMNVIFGPVVRSFDEATIERSFKCGVALDTERQNNVKKFSLYCFNPSFGIRSLLKLGVQSIIITSGTLSPLRTFIAELCLPDPITLQNGHIAKKCQVPFVILGTGVNKIAMDGSYKNRNEPKYKSSLGLTLTNLIASVPDGVLLLFSSYTMMQNLKETWESDFGIWTRLNSLKRVFVEPRNKIDFINCMENYKRAIDSGNGAILMGVLRGKISEGMDFKDQYCRGVFIIGVPFPPVQDPRVKGKANYSESLTIVNGVTKVEEKLYNNHNSQYISVEAMKTVNQAIGRVIRHGRDYGVIVLVDYRFAKSELFQNISLWLRGTAPSQKDFPTTKKLVGEFFKDVHTGKLGVEEIRCQPVDSNGCPIAGYVKYEEYDHKVHGNQTPLWVGGSPPSSQKPKSQPAKPRGHSTIEYVDENPANLFSMYKSTKKETTESSGEPSQNPGSLLELLERSRSTGIGYREFDKNDFGQFSESGKRKHEEDEESSAQSSPRLKYSPSLLSSPEACQFEKQKKSPRIKLRPLIPISKAENDVDGPAKPEKNSRHKREEEEELKVKLIDYYRLAKQSLSKEDDQKFKTCSYRYMNGDASLADVIELMDEFFLIPGKKNLFAGFAICLKGKDKELWKEACKSRKINLE